MLADSDPRYYKINPFNLFTNTTKNDPFMHRFLTGGPWTLKGSIEWA